MLVVFSANNISKERDGNAALVLVATGFGSFGQSAI